MCARGTSKANSAIVHAGFDAEPGTLKAKMNVRGNQLMDQIAEELDVPFSRVGAFVVCLREEELPKLEELYQRGLKNGVPDLELLTGDEAKALEPNLTDEVCGALWARTSGIVCPFALTLGLAESAAKNGVEFSFDTAVTGLEQIPEGWLVKTNQGDFAARAVVNAAGVYADEVHNWVCEEKLSIIPRKGEYCLLDKTAGGHVGRTIFQLPGKYGKGVLVSPTIHGNLLVGPTAVDDPDREDTATTAAGIADLTEKAALSVKNVPMRQVITSFMGLRAHEAGEDFVLGESAEGFFDAAGIESPGLTSAPAIGEYLAGLIGGEAGPGGQDRLRPHPEGRAPSGGHEPRGAGGKNRGKPGLRQHHLPMRGSERGRDLRRHPRHPGRQDLRRGQAPHPGGHGPLPGGVLLPPGDGPAVPGA